MLGRIYVLLGLVTQGAVNWDARNVLLISTAKGTSKYVYLKHKIACANVAGL